MRDHKYENPVMALQGTDPQIAMGPTLCCMLHLQLSVAKKQTNKELWDGFCDSCVHIQSH